MILYHFQKSSIISATLVQVVLFIIGVDIIIAEAVYSLTFVRFALKYLSNAKKALSAFAILVPSSRDNKSSFVLIVLHQGTETLRLSHRL